ncbi:redoxin domain-containing protein [uncultured Pontibacter sp.]|uniref:peroxiredoxin family protein n=1 Tax=uncultured Pontibacter sp. TaxID=453356 RepID=UPI0026141019|nr:redoxin domain-containing protein [uncultured Pontibacter sp.]
MKKPLLFLVALLFVSALAFMSVEIYSKSKQNEENKLTRQTLPTLQFYTLDSLAVSNSIVEVGSSTCIVYFDPDCSHCESETKEITSNIERFGHSQIFMISANTPKKIADFTKQFHLGSYPTIQVLWDKEHLFYKLFGNATVPSVYIYDRQQQLVKEYFGEVKAEAIIKHLH